MDFGDRREENKVWTRMKCDKKAVMQMQKKKKVQLQNNKGLQM